MGQVEDFQEWLNKYKPKNDEEARSQKSRVFHMHLSQAMAGFDAPMAQLILLGISRELVMEMVDACYRYWVSRTNLEELQSDECGPDDGPSSA